jgi:hypothetical protein
MLRKRAGRPRSEISSGDETAAPAAAIQRASRTSCASRPRVKRATAPITAAAPAAPPAKK